jgi:hypothetical protein
VASDLPAYERAIKEARRIVRQRKVDDDVAPKFGMRTPRERRAVVQKFKTRGTAPDR